MTSTMTRGYDWLNSTSDWDRRWAVWSQRKTNPTRWNDPLCLKQVYWRRYERRRSSTPKLDWENEIRSVERRCLSQCHNSVKNWYPCKISLKSDNWLLNYGQKTIFNMAAVRHVEFLKRSYLVIWLLSSSKCAVVYQISSKLYNFSLRYGGSTTFKMPDLRHLES